MLYTNVTLNYRYVRLNKRDSHKISDTVSDYVPIFGMVWSVFFFSSRRRHTRCSRDWSSDVCSSDLVQQLHVLAGFAEPDVYRDLLELGNRHAVLPAKALHQRRDRLSPVFFLQSAFHRPLRLIVYLYLSSVALQCRQLRIFEPSGKIVWPTRVCLPQLGQTIITLEALMLPSFSMIPPFTFFEGLGRVWRLMMPTCSTTTVFFWPLTQRTRPLFPASLPRSEEHTSELQSRLHLVCRLLLVKKNSTVRPI